MVEWLRFTAPDNRAVYLRDEQMVRVRYVAEGEHDKANCAIDLLAGTQFVMEPVDAVMRIIKGEPL